jgi:hypothetical protein
VSHDSPEMRRGVAHRHEFVLRTLNSAATFTSTAIDPDIPGVGNFDYDGNSL